MNKRRFYGDKGTGMFKKKYSHHSVTCQGKKDGRNWKWKFWPIREPKSRVPHTDTDKADFIDEILRSGEAIIAAKAENWVEKDRELKQQYCAAKHRLNNAEQRYLQESKEADEALQEYNIIKQKYEEINVPSIDPRWKNVWLVLIGIAEFPLNGLVFSIFGAGRLETYIMASMLCIALPLLAHLFGVSLHQEIKHARERWILIIIPVFVFFIIGAIALIRAKYFEVLLLDSAVKISLSPLVATILFIIINLALFFVAMIISYEGSHPNQKYYKTILKRHKAVLKKLKKEKGEALEAGREMNDADIEYQRIKNKREKIHSSFLHEINSIVERADWLTAAYRAANISVRDDRPLCLKGNLPTIILKENYAILDTNCDN